MTLRRYMGQEIAECDCETPATCTAAEVCLATVRARAPLHPNLFHPCAVRPEYTPRTPRRWFRALRDLYRYKRPWPQWLVALTLSVCGAAFVLSFAALLLFILGV